MLSVVGQASACEVVERLWAGVQYSSCHIRQLQARLRSESINCIVFLFNTSSFSIRLQHKPRTIVLTYVDLLPLRLFRQGPAPVHIHLPAKHAGLTLTIL